jgi:hypothetical protein
LWMAVRARAKALNVTGESPFGEPKRPLPGLKQFARKCRGASFGAKREIPFLRKNREKERFLVAALLEITGRAQCCFSAPGGRGRLLPKGQHQVREGI